MTASELAKKYGLKSLSELSKYTGKPRQTLRNWHNHEPMLFEIVCLGVIQKRKKERSEL